MDTDFDTSKMSIAMAVACAVGAPPLMAQSKADDTSLFETVVVTARKTAEKINEVPLAITAFSSDELSRRNVESLRGRREVHVRFLLRGLRRRHQPGARHPRPDPNALTDRNQNVATFVDGIHIQQQPNIDFGLLDIERIEVLKGPQNSQYGHSAFAGAINYVSAQPVLGELTGSVSATLGTDERRDLKGSISIPLWGDKLAVRVYGITSEFDGTWANKFSGGSKAVATTSMLVVASRAPTAISAAGKARPRGCSCGSVRSIL